MSGVTKRVKQSEEERKLRKSQRNHRYYLARKAQRVSKRDEERVRIDKGLRLLAMLESEMASESPEK